MDLQQKQQQLKRSREEAKLQFIIIELDLAITFCRIAVSADEYSKSFRNVAHARRAYESAAHFLDGRLLASPHGAEIKKKLTQFESMIRQITERNRQGF